MSITNPMAQRVANPITKNVKWKADSGIWQMYDKETKSQTDLKVKELKGIVLDANVNRVNGYNQKENISVNSGYFRFVNDPIKVYKGSELFIGGTWKEHNEKIKAAGGKWCAVLPIVTNKGVLVAIELTGAAMSVYFEYKQKTNMDEHPGIRFFGKEQQEKKMGSNTIKWFVPTVEAWDDYDQDLMNVAIEADKEFQAYMDSILSPGSSQAEQVDSDVHNESGAYSQTDMMDEPASEEEEDNLPF